MQRPSKDQLGGMAIVVFMLWFVYIMSWGNRTTGERVAVDSVEPVWMAYGDGEYTLSLEEKSCKISVRPDGSIRIHYSTLLIAGKVGFTITPENAVDGGEVGDVDKVGAFCGLFGKYFNTFPDAEVVKMLQQVFQSHMFPIASEPEFDS